MKLLLQLLSAQAPQPYNSRGLMLTSSFRTEKAPHDTPCQNLPSEERANLSPVA